MCNLWCHCLCKGFYFLCYSFQSGLIVWNCSLSGKCAISLNCDVWCVTLILTLGIGNWQKIAKCECFVGLGLVSLLGFVNLFLCFLVFTFDRLFSAMSHWVNVWSFKKFSVTDVATALPGAVPNFSFSVILRFFSVSWFKSEVALAAEEMVIMMDDLSC